MERKNRDMKKVLENNFIMQEKRLLDMKELQQFLGVSRCLTYELANRSDFPSARIGKRIVVPMDSLMEWLKNGGTAQRNNANSL